MRKFIGLIAFLVVFTQCKTPVSVPNNSVLGMNLTQPQMPLLTKKENVMLEIISPFTNQPLRAVEVTLKTSKKLSDLSEISVYISDDDNLSSAKLFGKSNSINEKTNINGKANIAYRNTLFITAKTIENPDLLNTVAVEKVVLTAENGEKFTYQISKENLPQRMGLTLREKFQDDINTYRIPGLATTNKGTLIAVYDNRHDSSVDLQGNINVGMSRSTDGGQTWEPMKEIMNMGTYGNKSVDENGIGDPSILVDKATNTIWVVALWQHGDKGKRVWWASKPGLTPEQTGQLMMVKSEDDGKTWSEPINITEQVKDPKWYLFFDGPGKGITLEDGTIMFPAQYKDENQIPHSTVIYSKDHGKTWKSGIGARSHTTEAQVVQLSNGDIMLNMRDDRNRNNNKLTDGKFARAVAVSSDYGHTWREHPTSRKSLRASNCMASLIKTTQNGKPIYFFSNPDSKYKRNRISIKRSDDDANTWTKYPSIVLYEADTYGYSCMTPIDEEHIGILYEGEGDLFFQKIPISDWEK